MLESLPIALAQTKAGHALVNWSEVKNVVYSLHHAKEITKKHIKLRLSQKKWIL